MAGVFSDEERKDIEERGKALARERSPELFGGERNLNANDRDITNRYAQQAMADYGPGGKFAVGEKPSPSFDRNNYTGPGAENPAIQGRIGAYSPQPYNAGAPSSMPGVVTGLGQYGTPSAIEAQSAIAAARNATPRPPQQPGVDLGRIIGAATGLPIGQGQQDLWHQIPGISQLARGWDIISELSKLRGGDYSGSNSVYGNPREGGYERGADRDYGQQYQPQANQGPGSAPPVPPPAPSPIIPPAPAPNYFPNPYNPGVPPQAGPQFNTDPYWGVTSMQQPMPPAWSWPQMNPAYGQGPQVLPGGQVQMPLTQFPQGQGTIRPSYPNVPF